MSKRTIFYMGVNNGDGSVGVEFFESQECIDLIEQAAEENDDYERLCGESGSFTVDGEISDISI